MSTITIFHATNGELELLPVQASSLDDATLQTGHGVYAVFRVYPGLRVLHLGRHLERMRESAALLGQPYALADEWLRAVLRRAMQASGLADARVRITVPYTDPGTALIALEPFERPDPTLYAQGVRVGLAQYRRERARVKDSRFIEKRIELQRALGDGFYEILLQDEQGCILEGTSSNFYAVLDGALFTAAEGVLWGVARRLILEEAPAILPVRFQPVRVEDLPHLSEAMLSSASRGPVPIVAIGDQIIGAGQPGPVFAALRAAYDARVERELEPL